LKGRFLEWRPYTHSVQIVKLAVKKKNFYSNKIESAINAVLQCAHRDVSHEAVPIGMTVAANNGYNIRN